MYWYNLKIEKPSQNNSALYDFEAENYGELTIVEGQKIELLSQPDNEWFEGRVDGKIGFFPIRYVKVIVPLPLK